MKEATPTDGTAAGSSTQVQPGDKTAVAAVLDVTVRY